MPARRPVLRTVGLLVAAAPALLAAPAATAAPGLGPVQQVVDPRCTFDEDRALAWTGPDGVEHVFYGLEGNESFTCGGERSGTTWHARRSPGGTWTRQLAPFRGTLLAVAGDASGVHVMYADLRGIWLVRRTPAGAYQTVRMLSPLGLGTRVRPTGGLVVRDGRWWAVWTENRTPDTFGTTDLWQARTMHAPLVRTRVTDTPGAHDDLPQLALRKDGSAFLLWTEMDEATGAVRLTAGSSRGAAWSTRVWDDRSPALSTDVATSPSGVTGVLWGREGRLLYADDSSGTFRTQAVPTGDLGGPPALALSATGVHVAVTTREQRARLVSRPAAGGAWTALPVTTTTLGSVRAVTVRQGRVTVLYSDERRLLGRTTG